MRHDAVYEITYQLQPATFHRSQRDPASYRHLRVRPASGALGAEVTGIDLAALSDDSLGELERALADHLVLFVRDQTLSPADQIAFARRLGPLITWPFAKALDGHPEIMEVRSEPDDVYNFGGSWHSDSASFERPPKLTILYCLQCPQVGGDTSFANQYLAWETLSEGLRRLLEPMTAVNSSALYVGGHAGSREVVSRTSTRLEETAARDEVNHPVARTHPVTGRKALFVCDSFTARFTGMTQPESLPLLRYLWQHAVRQEFTCRFQWRPGTLAVWDNRCAMHYAHNDYPGHRRLMHRIVVEGERPV